MKKRRFYSTVCCVNTFSVLQWTTCSRTRHYRPRYYKKPNMVPALGKLFGSGRFFAISYHDVRTRPATYCRLQTFSHFTERSEHRALVVCCEHYTSGSSRTKNEKKSDGQSFFTCRRGIDHPKKPVTHSASFKASPTSAAVFSAVLFSVDLHLFLHTLVHASQLFFRTHTERTRCLTAHGTVFTKKETR